MKPPEPTPARCDDLLEHAGIIYSCMHRRGHHGSHESAQGVKWLTAGPRPGPTPSSAGRALEQAATLALEWFAGFPHGRDDSVSSFTLETASVVYNALKTALAAPSMPAEPDAITAADEAGWRRGYNQGWDERTRFEGAPSRTEGERFTWEDWNIVRWAAEIASSMSRNPPKGAGPHWAAQCTERRAELLVVAEKIAVLRSLPSTTAPACRLLADPIGGCPNTATGAHAWGQLHSRATCTACGVVGVAPASPRNEAAFLDSAPAAQESLGAAPASREEDKAPAYIATLKEIHDRLSGAHAHECAGWDCARCGPMASSSLQELIDETGIFGAAPASHVTASEIETGSDDHASEGGPGESPQRDVQAGAEARRQGDEHAEAGVFPVPEGLPGERRAVGAREGVLPGAWDGAADRGREGADDPVRAGAVHGVAGEGGRDPSSVMQDDMIELMGALGLPMHARPESPHEVMQREIIPAVKRRAAPASESEQPTCAECGYDRYALVHGEAANAHAFVSHEPEQDARPEEPVGWRVKKPSHVGRGYWSYGVECSDEFREDARLTMVAELAAWREEGYELVAEALYPAWPKEPAEAVLVPIIDRDMIPDTGPCDHHPPGVRCMACSDLQDARPEGREPDA